jgi:CheY-like chemotaxis protein
VLKEVLSRYVHNLEVTPTANLEQSAEELRRVPAQALVINAPSVGEGLEEVRRFAGLPNDAPVLVCAVPDLLDRSRDLGVSDYLLKPVTRSRLLAALENLSPRAKKVLVVDDEAEALRLFWRMLSSEQGDYQVLTASDGEQALAVMRAQKPDAVILDLVMPRMDGFRLLEQRSQDPSLLQIPIIVVSALDPSGSMILSSALAVTRPEGLTVPQLLGCLEGLSRLFAAGRPNDQGSPAAPRG